MPFINSDFLFDDEKTVSQVLITCADDSNVIQHSFKLAIFWADKGYNVLWVDGNLGEHPLKDIDSSPDLKKVLQGKLPLTHVLQKVQGISVLAGNTDIRLAELDEMKQYQFLQDLNKIYSNFDKVILAIDGKNPALQKKWMEVTENIYLLFNAKNLLLGRTLNWLEENPTKAKGLIGIGKNEQAVLLSYMRLKEILGKVPELILDIKKIAP